jgi:hypothetical protein
VTSSPTTSALLERLVSFLLPGGCEAARKVRAIKTIQTGEMFTSAKARPTLFAAEEIVETRETGFCWDARFRTGMRVTDSYENGRGRLVVSVGGLLPLKRLSGADFDKGELQRYLAYPIGLCPPIILNNSALLWSAIRTNVLRVSEVNDKTGAWVEIEIGNDGCPVSCWAQRPRLEGNRAVLTTWSAVANDFREQDGIRFAWELASRWHEPEMFTAVRIRLSSVELLK